MEELILDHELANKPLVPATRGTRFLGLLIDLAAYFLCCVVLGIFLALIGMGEVLEEVNDTVFGFFAMTIYYLLTEGITGRSIGKLITKTKVLNENDEKPTFINILGRTLCRFIPFDALSFLGNGYGWHDSISKTKVVKI